MNQSSSINIEEEVREIAAQLVNHKNRCIECEEKLLNITEEQTNRARVEELKRLQGVEMCLRPNCEIKHPRLTERNVDNRIATLQLNQTNHKGASNG